MTVYVPGHRDKPRQGEAAAWRHADIARDLREAIAAGSFPVGTVLLDRRLSFLLHAEPGSPGLQIVRRYLDKDGGLAVGSVSVHPASWFHVASSLECVGPD